MGATLEALIAAFCRLDKSLSCCWEKGWLVGAVGIEIASVTSKSWRRKELYLARPEIDLSPEEWFPVRDNKRKSQQNHGKPLKCTYTWIEAASGRRCRESLPLHGRLYCRPRYYGRIENGFKLACARKFEGGLYGNKTASSQGVT